MVVIAHSFGWVVHWPTVPCTTVTWEEFESAYTHNPSLLNVFAKVLTLCTHSTCWPAVVSNSCVPPTPQPTHPPLSGQVFGVNVNPDGRLLMSGKVHQISRMLREDQARNYEAVKRYGGMDTTTAERQLYLLRKNGWRELRRQQSASTTVALHMMRRASMDTAANIVSVMQENLDPTVEGSEDEDSIGVQSPQAAQQDSSRDVMTCHKGRRLHGYSLTHSLTACRHRCQSSTAGRRRWW